MCFIKREADYAVRIVAYLASQGRKVKIYEICDDLFLNRPIVVKVIHKLSKCGIVSTETGKNGGVFISGDKSELSIYDVLTCMRFVSTFNICVGQPEKCLLNPICNITSFFANIQRDIESKLKNAKIKEFVFDKDKLKLL